MRTQLLQRERALLGTVLASLGLLFASPHARAENDAGSSLGFAGGGPVLPNAVRVLRQPDASAVLPRMVPPAAPPLAAQPHQPPPQPQLQPQRWSDAEELAARAHCGRVLARIPVQFSYLPQMRSGACGSAAPIEVTSLGAGKSTVAVSPPLVINCDLAAALFRWMSEQVQPLAKRHLGASIIQLNTMSSYSCRNRYGARQAPLSQHAFANAIDLRGFITARGELIDLELHWGPTEAEEAIHAAALAQARVQAAQAPVQARTLAQPRAAAQAHGPLAFVSPAPATTAFAQAPIAASLKPSFPVLMRPSPQTTVRIVATGQLATLGAPSVQPGQPLDARAKFLRHAHGTGCGTFGTVLGPESNKWHRNHLHFDLAQRKSGPFCQ